MDDYSKHIKFHTDTMIRLRALEFALNEAKIPCLIKNISESARLGGFGSSHSANELYIYEEDKDAASEILTKFLNV
ncbi:MAG: DUF2007 domain-containing protein [Flavobacteriaceae bacterium]